MVLAWLVLGTPSMGPPPSTGPLKPELKPELEMELEGDDSGELEFPSAFELLESPVAGVCPAAVTACCTPPGSAAKAPRAPASAPPSPPPIVPCPGHSPAISPN